MQINFTSHKIEITPAIRQFAIGKFDKLARHFDKITEINVVFDVENIHQVAEATVFVNQTKFHARVQSEDLYNSIDGLADKLDRQIIKHKEKTKNHKAADFSLDAITDEE